MTSADGSASTLRRRPQTLETAPRARDAFLQALAAGLTIGEASRRAKVARGTVYRWRAVDKDFASAWEDAYADGTDVFEREVRRRAVEGVEEPVIQMGRIAKDDAGKVITVRRYSDTLLLAGLKRRDPSWREKTTTDVNMKAEEINTASPVERIRQKIEAILRESAAQTPASVDHLSPDFEATHRTGDPDVASGGQVHV